MVVSAPQKPKIGAKKGRFLYDFIYTFPKRVYPQYYNRVAIYDLQPTQEQKTIMHMLENEYGSKSVYSDQDNAFQSFKIQTAEVFMKLYQSLEDYQIDLLKKSIHSMMALIEAISCFEK